MYPKLFELGPLALHTYGLFLAIAFIAGIWITSRNARREGINADAMWNMGLVVLCATLIGCKLLMLITDFSYYAANPRKIFSLETLRSMGVFYGGLLLALGAAAWYLRKRRLPAWKVADCAAPGIALGQVIGRLGCLAAGCCYGAPTDIPWSICFTNAYAHENMGTPLNIPLHPTQIYESLGALFLFAYLTWRRSRPHANGQVILLYLGFYAALRFVIELFRADYRGAVFNGLLSTSQFIAVITFAAAVVFYIYLGRRGASTKVN